MKPARIVCAHITRTGPDHFRVFLTRQGQERRDTFSGRIPARHATPADPAPRTASERLRREAQAAFTLGNLLSHDTLQSLGDAARTHEAARARELRDLAALTL